MKIGYFAFFYFHTYFRFPSKQSKKKAFRQKHHLFVFSSSGKGIPPAEKPRNKIRPFTAIRIRFFLYICSKTKTGETSAVPAQFAPAVPVYSVFVSMKSKRVWC